jgi:hypothetical protein
MYYFNNKSDTSYTPIYLPLDKSDSNCTTCLMADTNNSRLQNKTKENWKPREDTSIQNTRNKLDKNPKFSPLTTSTSSNTLQPRTPRRKTKLSPIIVNNICLLFERGMQPNFLVPLMWKVGYFHRNDGVMSLFQVSKEFHLKGVDILRADTVI